LNAQK